MKLLLLSDIHGDLGYLPGLVTDLQHAEMVVVAGDVTTFGDAVTADRIIDSIQRFNPHVLSVSGNCDPQPVTKSLRDRGILLDGQAVTRDGFCFVGVGGSLPCPGRTPNEVGEAALADALEQAVLACDQQDLPLILVSHQPAHGTRVDMVRGGRSSGSHAIRQFIETRRPILAVSGHIHEALGTDAIGPTTLVNPGPFKAGHYAIASIEGDRVQVRLKRA